MQKKLKKKTTRTQEHNKRNDVSGFYLILVVIFTLSILHYTNTRIEKQNISSLISIINQI